MHLGVERWIEADGVRVHAVEWGTPDRDQRILLVPGLGANTVSWEPVGARLADALHATVVAVDLAGFGLTRLPPGRRATVGANGRLVADLLRDHLGPAVVMGNSMGGAIAVGLAARHPDLVRALVLVDPALPQSGVGLPAWQVIARFAPLVVPQVGSRYIGFRARRLGPARLVETTLEWTLADRNRLDPAVHERLVEVATTRREFPEAARAYADAARSLFFYIQGGGMGADIGRVRCPTLVAHGALDRLVPVASARTLARRRDDFTLAVIDGCGHAPQLEMPDRFLELVTPWVAELPQVSASA